MAKDRNKTKTRVSIDLNEAFYRRLDNLESLTQADSKADVIRDALRVAEFIAKKTSQGYKFALVDPSGRHEHILFFDFSDHEAKAKEEYLQSPGLVPA